MKECKYCNGKEDISNKVFEDGSTYSDTNCKVYIQKDLIYDWCLKVAPVRYRHGEKFQGIHHCFQIKFCPMCGRKLSDD
jgi:hypothetical protein